MTKSRCQARQCEWSCPKHSNARFSLNKYHISSRTEWPYRQCVHNYHHILPKVAVWICSPLLPRGNIPNTSFKHLLKQHTNYICNIPLLWTKCMHVNCICNISLLYTIPRNIGENSRAVFSWNVNGVRMQLSRRAVAQHALGPWFGAHRLCIC